MPTTNEGAECRNSDVPTVTRSNRPPRRQPATAPMNVPSTTEITRAGTIISVVLTSLSSMISRTGSFWKNDWPKSNSSMLRR